MSCLMGILMLSSGTVFAVTTHYCGGEIAKITYFGKAEGCGMEMNLSGPTQSQISCCDKPMEAPAPAISNLPCCDNDTQIFEIDGDVDLTVTSILSTVSYTTQSFYPVATSSATPLTKAIKAPPLCPEIIVLTQSFLL